MMARPGGFEPPTHSLEGVWFYQEKPSLCCALKMPNRISAHVVSGNVQRDLVPQIRMIWYTNSFPFAVNSPAE